MEVSERIQVLLVEDNPTDVLLAREALEEAPQFRLSHTSRLANALDLLQGNGFQVVLLDLGLPDSQGLDTLLTLRRSDPGTAVIVMTGRDDEELAVRSVHEGAEDYLVKSQVGAGNLARSIRYAFERNAARRALQERSMLAALTAEVSLAFTQVDALPDMLRLCTESMVRNLNAALARIWTLDAAENVLKLQANSGMPASFEVAVARVAVGQPNIGLIAQEKKPHLTNDLGNDAQFSERAWAKRESMVGFAGYPLLIRDRLVGVVALYARVALSPLTLDSLASVANQIAVGIERQSAEQALFDSNERLEKVIQSAPLAVVVLDADQRVRTWNTAAQRIFGWTEAEVFNQPLPFVPPDRQAELRAIHARELAGEAVVRLETQRLRRDGTLVDLQLSAAALHDAAGAYTGSIRILADVTEQKQLEGQLRQAQKMEAVGQLAGGVAHDFNNLLTIINGYSELLLSKAHVDGATKGALKQIQKAGERAAALTRQLLAFSRKEVVELAVLDVNAVVSDVDKMLRRIIGEDVTLATALAPALDKVKADPGQIEQVIMNLAVNARDAMPQGGKLTIETANVELDEAYARAHAGVHSGRYVMLAVSDTGSGMDETTKARIFEPFFTTKGIGKGTGLGLATVYGIVKQGGGHIYVYSEPGKGSAFKVYFPVVLEAEASPRPAERGPTGVGTETVLVVEDDDGVRALTKLALLMHGYTVLEASGGPMAVELARANVGPIHLLLTDVIMPEMSGRQVAEHVSHLRPGIKVLYLSGYTDDAVVRHGILHDQEKFLQKPFTFEALARKVREILTK